MNLDKLSIMLMIGLLIGATACHKETETNPIPFVSFNNITINLNRQEALALKTKGYMSLKGGVKGIIVYKSPTGEYVAFEQNCSYEPTSDCAKVEVDSSGFFMVDNCCKSTFGFPEGFPTSGPATFPLRKYRTVLSGNLLTITDEPLPK